MEYAHHGDALVPRQQRFGKYTRSLMKGLGVPVENRYGLRPGVVTGTISIAPLTVNRDLDTRGWLERRVTNFNFHMHLPHYAVTTEDTSRSSVLARSRSIWRSRIRSPRRATGSSTRSSGCRRGRAAERFCWPTRPIFSTLFGADDSLKRFWKNLATVK